MAWLPLILGVLDVCGGGNCVLRVDSPERVLEALRDLPGIRVESVTARKDRLTARICSEVFDCKDLELRAQAPDCPGRPAGALCLVVPSGIPDSLATAWADRLAEIPSSRLWNALPEALPDPRAPERPPPSSRESGDGGSRAEAPGWIAGLVSILVALLLLVAGGWLGGRLAKGWPTASTPAGRWILLLVPSLASGGIGWALSAYKVLWDLLLAGTVLGLGLRWGAVPGGKREAVRAAGKGLGGLLGLLVIAEAFCRLALPPAPSAIRAPATPPVPPVGESGDQAIPGPQSPGDPIPVPPPRALGGPFPLAVLHLRFAHAGLPDAESRDAVLQAMNRRDPGLWHLAIPIPPGNEGRTWNRIRQWIEAERVVGIVFHLAPGLPCEDRNPPGGPDDGVPPSPPGEPRSWHPAPPLALRSLADFSSLAARLLALFPGERRDATGSAPDRKWRPGTQAALARAVASLSSVEGIPVAAVLVSDTAAPDGEAARDEAVPPSGGCLRESLGRIGIPVHQARGAPSADGEDGADAPAAAGPLGTPETVAGWLLEVLAPLRSKARALSEVRVRAFPVPR